MISIKHLAWNIKFANCLKAFRRDAVGVAAIEFALVVPFLLLLMIGSISVFDGIRGWTTYGNTVATISDLISRQIRMDDGKRDLMIASARALANKYSKMDDFTVIIASIENELDPDDDTTLTIDWSEASRKSEELTDKDLVNFKLPVLAESETIILVIMTGTYKPIIFSSTTGDFHFERHAVRRPRFVHKIPYEDD
ncbi:MAG: pilus assembly protein [Rhizobiales bacterium]|nr:pilus assembly protein [Hyphomicrobiales bacterium]